MGFLNLAPGVLGRSEGDDVGESTLAAAHPVPSFLCVPNSC